MRHTRERASQPDDLSRLFLQRANAGDVEGLVALYEADAVLAMPNGGTAQGHQQIRDFYQQLLADQPKFDAGDQAPTLRNGPLALTSTRLPDGNATAEIARSQPDGTWLWTVDQPSVLA